jgi:hypothetical protein
MEGETDGKAGYTRPRWDTEMMSRVEMRVSKFRHEGG